MWNAGPLLFRGVREGLAPLESIELCNFIGKHNVFDKMRIFDDDDDGPVRTRPDRARPVQNTLYSVKM